MNIILTGLRGSGKTTVGKILAKKLKWKFVDLDKEIEKEEKMKIKDIVELKGWEYFRAKEAEVTKKVAQLDKKIISTGGGTIIDKDNEVELKKNGKVVYLYVQPDTCADRILNDSNRPSLTDKKTLKEEINEIYRQRNGRYIKSANKIFHRTENPEKDVEELINTLLKKETPYN